MASTGGRVRIIFEGDDSGLQRALKSSDAALSRFSSTAKRSSEGVRAATRTTETFSSRTRSLGSMLANAAKYAAGAAVAYIGISQARDAVTTTQDLAKATISLNKNLGISVHTASEWAAVARARGIDSTKLGMAFKTLATQVVAARDGSASAKQKFHELGLSQKEIAKGSKDTTFLVGQVADGLNNLKGGADKAAISGTLFGRGWQTVAPILRDGSVEMQKQLDLANHYGAAFGGKTIKSFQDLIASERELKLAQLGLQVQFTEHIAPALIDVGLKLAHFINQMRTGKGAGGTFADVMKVVIDAFRVAGFVIGWFVKAFVAMTKAVIDAAKFLGRIFSGVFGSIGSVFQITVSGIKSGAKFMLRIFSGLGKGIGAVAHGIMSAFHAVASVVKDVVHFIVGAVNKILSVINDVKDALPSISLPSLPSIPSPGDFISAINPFAAGGPVPGTGEGDKVPAMLEPGEFVVNKRATALSRPMLEAINSGAPRHGSPNLAVLPMLIHKASGGQVQGAGRRRYGGGRQTVTSRPVRSHWPSQVGQSQGAIDRYHAAMRELAGLIREQNARLDAMRTLGSAEKAVLRSIMGGAGSNLGLRLQSPAVAGSLASY